MQNPLIIPVERLHTAPLELDLVLAPDVLDLKDPEFTFDEPVRLKARVETIVQDVMATGTMQTTATTPCVRCLTPTRVELNVPLQETWFKTTPEQIEEDEATGEHITLIRTYEGDELDLTEDLRELMMSELPERVYCAEDCKGICAGCGANLNSEKCRCGEKAGEAAPGEAGVPNWKSALKQIKLD